MHSDEATSGNPLRTDSASNNSETSASERPVRPIADMPSPNETNQEAVPDGRGHFFGLHFPTFLETCRLGINHAVTYIVLARGTQADNRTTTWSTNSVETYTRISRKKAQRCIEELEEAKLIERVGGTKHRPIRAVFEPPRKKHTNLAGETLDDDGERIMNDLPLADRGRTKKVKNRLLEMATEGWVELIDGKWHPQNGVKLIPPKADLVWVPNSLVDGLEGGNSPSEVLRQTQCQWTLCLLISLYKAHELTFSQGVSTEVLLEAYKRRKLDEYREFDMFEFTRDGPRVRPEAEMVTIFENSDSDKSASAQFFEALDTLIRLGLVTFIPHLFDGPEGEVLFPLAEPRDGADATNAEGKLFDAVKAASTTHCPDNRERITKPGEGVPLKVLVQNHMRKAQLIGIARLRHRPRTTVTAEWYSQSDEWDNWTELYQNLSRETRLAKVLA